MPKVNCGVPVGYIADRLAATSTRPATSSLSRRIDSTGPRSSRHRPGAGSTNSTTSSTITAAWTRPGGCSTNSTTSKASPETPGASATPSTNGSTGPTAATSTTLRWSRSPPRSLTTTTDRASASWPSRSLSGRSDEDLNCNRRRHPHQRGPRWESKSTSERTSARTRKPVIMRWPIGPKRRPTSPVLGWRLERSDLRLWSGSGRAESIESADTAQDSAARPAQLRAVAEAGSHRSVAVPVATTAPRHRPRSGRRALCCCAHSGQRGDMEMESTTLPDPVTADERTAIRVGAAIASAPMIVLLAAALLVQIEVTDAEVAGPHPKLRLGVLRQRRRPGRGGSSGGPRTSMNPTRSGPALARTNRCPQAVNQHVAIAAVPGGGRGGCAPLSASISCDHSTSTSPEIWTKSPVLPSPFGAAWRHGNGFDLLAGSGDHRQNGLDRFRRCDRCGADDGAARFRPAGPDRGDRR